MEARGLSIAETARRADLKDKKRFYRWAASGISRAAHDHHDDLERLQKLFRLQSVEQLWTDAPGVTLEDLLLSAATGNPDYEYAYKLLVVLRGSEAERADEYRNAINDVFAEVTREVSAEHILRILTPEEILEQIKQRCPRTYDSLTNSYYGGMPALLKMLAGLAGMGEPDPAGHLIKVWDSD